ncbi:MAG TPA: acyl-CoA dehydrogenase family protein [Terriglobia bacterium]|nr:acyl-CoA dehydrogenase family protein [Terriglobia bacterium]
MMRESPASKGGLFLLRDTPPASVFTPADFTEEHLLIRNTAEQFVEQEVLPQLEAIERQHWDVTVGLLRKCGDLGLLSIEIPEQYGGADLDKVSAAIVAEQMARVMSFSVSFGGQSGIGALPIGYFATEALKARYLPRIAQGELITAYALSESGSGSDALAARTTAHRSADGSRWILNGEKMWITNAAFADLFIVFAQVDGREFTCFAVERNAPGVSTGAEERKMGLKGSSTRTLILDHASIPIDAVIGEVGQGRHVAFNILNLGRAKLAAGALGAGKAALNESVRYARERVAFGGPIARFGAIQEKLARMAIRAWATEGMVYRAVASIDAALAAVDASVPAQALKAIEEYAIECSILKIYASEALDFIVDEAVQIHGGYGYSAEYAVERYYRDSRVNRIFEGTNEINRLIIFNMLMKRAAAGRLPLHEAIHAAAEEVWTGVTVGAPDGPLQAERAALRQSKQAFLFTAGLALEKYAQGAAGLSAIKEEQELLFRLADMAIAIYAMDTALARVLKRPRPSEAECAAASTLVGDATAQVERSAIESLARITDGTKRRESLAALRRLMAWEPIDSIKLQRVIAGHILDNRRYAL